ncbi:MAG: cryptochrome/photolyase family protein [Pseudomonadota bacterium]
MGRLRLVLGDQLTRTIAALRDAAPGEDVILMAEVREEATYVPHHKQKLVFLFSAMRAFAEELRVEGFTVRYVHLDDARNSGSLLGEVRRALREEDADGVVTTACGEHRLAEEMKTWARRLNTSVDILDDDRFLCTIEEFSAWAEGRKTLRMEFFYREMRKKTGLLMNGDQPEGGQWNFDQDNRKKLPKGYEPPPIPDTVDHPIVSTVQHLVEERFSDHFGTVNDFRYAVTRDDALARLDQFIDYSLPQFGDFQDAMATGEDFLNHGLLSAYLNAGLLGPLEVCEAAEEAYKEGHAPLNAVEGFIRQVIGWREFVRGIYWHLMPAYKETNALGADLPLPGFYWTAETDMHCVAEAVRNTQEHAYAHHIQRLMVTGNLALLLGVRPKEIEDWYLAVYADAYEWVELPNVHGMAIWADGGVLGSKPYAASGAYINRMSDYCRSCRYKVSLKTGPDACPFNYLYWDFLIRNESTLRGNPRMGLVFKNLDKKTEDEKAALLKSAQRFFAQLEA